MKLNGNAPELFDRISSLMLLEVSKTEIASVIGCELQELEEVLGRDDYKEVHAQKFMEEIEGQKTRNAGWDEVEARALTHLLGSIDSYAMDADFLLKVAAVGNKAQRRHPNQKPISAVTESRTVVLALNATFVERLQQYGSTERPGRQMPEKDNQLLDVEKVEELLQFRPGPDILIEEKEQERERVGV